MAHIDLRRDRLPRFGRLQLLLVYPPNGIEKLFAGAFSESIAQQCFALPDQVPQGPSAQLFFGLLRCCVPKSPDIADLKGRHKSWDAGGGEMVRAGRLSLPRRKAGEQDVVRYTYADCVGLSQYVNRASYNGSSRSHPVASFTCARMASANPFAASATSGCAAANWAVLLVTSSRASSTDTASSSSAWVIRIV